MSLPSLSDGSSLEPILWQFDRAWRRGEVPNIDTHLPTEGPRRRQALVELIAADLEWRFKLGQTVRVEHYLGRYPGLHDDPLLIELVAAEFRLRRSAEPTLDLEEYHSRFPQLRDALAGALQTQSMSPRAQPSGSTDSPLPLVPGYEIVRELGRGGMGVVYEALHLGLGRVVALKMLLHAEHADSADLVRFLGEAESVARLHHPNVVQLFETGRHNGLPYFTLELIPGGNLADRLREGLLRPKEAADLVRQVAQGVQHAHGRGIVHRDLKPSNLLLGEQGTPKVADFGLARRVELGSGVTVTGHVLGTPAYMAPEQAAGHKEVSPSADVYALGAILYECLTGRPPFKAATALETLQQVLNDEPVPVRQIQRGVPRDLETICLKCLHKEPTRRYGTAGELADDLARFLAGEAITARAVGSAERAMKWVQRRPAVAALTVGMVVLAMVASALVAWNWLDALAQRNRAEAAAAAERMAKNESDRKAKQEEEARERADQNLYLNRVALAQREWESNHVGLALDLLDACPVERRGWEWRYLRRLCQGTPLTIWGHTAEVSAVSWSPDGMRLATASYDRTVKVWDVRSRQELFSLTGHSEPVTAVSWSPDGIRLASASEDRMVKVWDVGAHQELVSFRGHTAPVNAVSWSPDGTRLASAGRDRMVRVWDARTGKENLILRGHIGTVNGVSWSPDGARLASGGGSTNAESQQLPGDVRVWDAQTGQETSTLRGHSRIVTAVSWSPDGTRLASADHNVLLWDMRTGEKTFTLKGHAHYVSAMSWSPDGMRLASASADHTVMLWDARTGEKTVPLKGHTDRVTGVSWGPDGTRLSSSSDDQTVKVWDTRSGQETLTLVGHTYFVNTLAWGPDGTRLASGSSDRTVKVWDARTGRETLSIGEHPDWVTSVSWSPDGTRLASAVGTSQGKGFPREVKVWDGRTGQELLALRGHTGGIGEVAWSPDGTRLASAGYDRTVRVWDARTGQETLSLKGHTQAVTSVAWSPDGMRLASAGDDRTVKVWDAQAGREQLNLEGHTGVVGVMSWAPDGSRLASCAGTVDAHGKPLPGEVKVWDAHTGQETFTLRGHTNRVLAVAWAPDGTRLASSSSDATVKLWDGRTGQEVLTLKGHIFGVPAVVWAPDGTRLASASGDRTVKIWDGRTFQEVLTLGGHTDRVTAVAWAPDGEHISARAGNGAWKTWEAGSGREVVPAAVPDMGEQRLAVSPSGRYRAVAVGPIVRVVDSQLSDEERAQLQLLWRDDPAWHKEQLQQAEQARDTFAAAFHLRQLIALNPDDPALLRRLGRLHAEGGQWREAVAVFARTTAHNPEWGNLVYLARAQLGAGQNEAYRATVHRLADRVARRRVVAAVGLAFGRTPADGLGMALTARLTARPLPEPTKEAGFVAELAVARPGVMEPAELLGLAEQAVPFFRGQLLCRAGRYDEASRGLAAVEPTLTSDLARAVLRLFRGLAEHGRGNRAAGRQALFQATAWLDATSKEDPKQTHFDRMDWGVRLELEGLRRECEQLLGVQREPGKMGPVRDGP